MIINLYYNTLFLFFNILFAILDIFLTLGAIFWREMKNREKFVFFARND